MINLGDVNFSLGADTARLTRSISELNQFSAAVSRVAASNVRGSNAIAQAMARQEKAAGSAFNRVQNLNNAIGRMNGTEKFIRANEAAFEQLNRTLTRGQLSALGYQRAMERFNTSIASTKRSFDTFKAAQQGLVGDNRNLVSSLQNLASGFVLVNGPLGGLATRIVSVTSIIKRGGVEVAAFVAGLAAGGYAILKFGGTVLEAGKALNSFESQFQAVTGSIIGGWKGVAEATAIARRTGTLIEDIAPGLARFEAAADGVGIAGKDIRDTFETVAFAATKLQLGSEQTAGIFRALEQIMSKGTVQAEELRGQLGDRLPGAFQIAARAMGVSTAKLGELMKKGLVPATTFIPKFTAELKKSFNIDGKPIDNYTAAVNNLRNSWFQLMSAVDDNLGVTKRVMELYKGLTGILDNIRENLGEIKIYTMAAFGALAGLAAPAIIGGILTLVGGLGKVATGAGAINKALNLLPGPIGVLVRLGSVIAGVGYAVSGVSDQIFVINGEWATMADYAKLAWEDINKWAQTALGDIPKYWNILQEEWVKFWDSFGTTNETGWSNFYTVAVTEMNNLAKEFKMIASELAMTLSALFNNIMADVQAVLGAINNGRKFFSPWIDAPTMNPDGTWTQGNKGFAGLESSGFLNKDFKRTSWDSLQTQIKAMRNNMGNGTLGTDIDAYLQDLRKRANSEASLRQMGNFRQSELKGWGQELGSPKKKSSGIFSDDGGGSGNSKALKRIQKAQEALANINREIERTQEEIEALGGTESGMRALNDQFKREDQVRKYAKAMEKAGIATDIIKQKSQELLEALELKDKLEKAREAFTEWQDSLVSAFDSVSGLLVDAAFDGGESLMKLPDIAKAVAKDIFNTFLQLALMNPLKNMMFGTDLPTIGGGFLGGLFGGGGGLPATGPIPMPRPLRVGGVVMGPITRYAAAGRMLHKPTTMMTGNGPVIGGEAGEEVIMPLGRDSSGRMGVRGLGGGGESGKSTINIYNQNAGETQIQARETESDDGSKIVDIIATKVFRRVSKGDADPIFAQRFGVSPKPNKKG